MPVFEFYITVFDKPNQGDKLRHDEGDIINVLEGGAEIGRKMLDYFLIVPININIAMTADELRSRLCIPLYDDGSREGVDWRIFDYRTDPVDNVTYPSTDYVWGLHEPQGPIAKPERLAKFRYRIPLDRFAIAQLDLNKVRDVSQLYQPLIAESRVAALPCFTNVDSDYDIRLDGSTYKIKKIKQVTRTYYEIDGKLYIDRDAPPEYIELTDDPEYDLQNETPVIDKDAEYQLSLLPGAQIIQDKYDDSYIGIGDL